MPSSSYTPTPRQIDSAYYLWALAVGLADSDPRARQIRWSRALEAADDSWEVVQVTGSLFGMDLQQYVDDRRLIQHDLVVEMCIALDGAAALCNLVMDEYIGAGHLFRINSGVTATHDLYESLSPLYRDAVATTWDALVAGLGEHIDTTRATIFPAVCVHPGEQELSAAPAVLKNPVHDLAKLASRQDKAAAIVDFVGDVTSALERSPEHRYADAVRPVLQVPPVPNSAVRVHGVNVSTRKVLLAVGAVGAFYAGGAAGVPGLLDLVLAGGTAAAARPALVRFQPLVDRVTEATVGRLRLRNPDVRDIADEVSPTNEIRRRLAGGAQGVDSVAARIRSAVRLLDDRFGEQIYKDVLAEHQERRGVLLGATVILATANDLAPALTSLLVAYQWNGNTMPQREWLSHVSPARRQEANTLQQALSVELAAIAAEQYERNGDVSTTGKVWLYATAQLMAVRDGVLTGSDAKEVLRRNEQLLRLAYYAPDSFMEHLEDIASSIPTTSYQQVLPAFIDLIGSAPSPGFVLGITTPPVSAQYDLTADVMATEPTTAQNTRGERFADRNGPQEPGSDLRL